MATIEQLLKRTNELVTHELDGEGRGKLYAILAAEFPDLKAHIGVAMWKANRKYETAKPLSDE